MSKILFENQVFQSILEILREISIVESFFREGVHCKQTCKFDAE